MYVFQTKQKTEDFKYSQNFPNLHCFNVEIILHIYIYNVIHDRWNK